MWIIEAGCRTMAMSMGSPLSISPLSSDRVVMVTGGAGFIGCHTVAALLRLGENVLLVDNSSAHGYPSSVKAANLQWLEKCASECPGTLRIKNADITDRIAMKSLFSNGINVVCHLAACAGARESILSPELFINSNVLGTTILLEQAALSRCSNFVYASSGSVYGTPVSSPTNMEKNMVLMREDELPGKLLSPYGVTKVAAESMAGVYHHLYNLPTTGLRFFTIYGPRGRPEMAPLKFMNLIYRGMPIEIFGDGSSWRDYTYIDDAVDSIIAAINKPHSCEVFNIGAGKAVRLSEFVETLQSVMGCTATVIRREESKGDVFGTFADIQKARTMLGYNPKVHLEQGLEAMFEWFKENLHAHEN